ncbi:MAG: magnesium transporter CorA family protein [Candidatus Nealsonbacteria bacterium]
MKKITKGKKVTWINIQRPTKKDLDYLKKRFNIHPLVLDELINPSHRPKVERHKNYIFMILYYPVYDKEKRITAPRELNIIATNDALITSHYKSILPLKTLFKSCRAYEESKKNYMGEGPGHLLYYVLSGFWKNCLSKLQKIDERIDKIEREIFSGKEKEMVLEISLVKTDIINFWRIIKPQNEVLDSLLKEGVDFFGENLSPYFSDILGIYDQVLNGLESHKEAILALEDTNQSLLSARINEIMKILTIFSVIVLPLTLISSIWGMNFPVSLPFTRNPIGFWVISVIMLVVMAGMILYFRKKKWL